jgi:hypothetical protein
VFLLKGKETHSIPSSHKICFLELCTFFVVSLKMRVENNLVTVIVQKIIFKMCRYLKIENILSK